MLQPVRIVQPESSGNASDPAQFIRALDAFALTLSVDPIAAPIST